MCDPPEGPFCRSKKMYPTPPPSQLRAMTDLGNSLKNKINLPFFDCLPLMPHCDISISSRPSTIFWGSSVIHPVHRNRRLLPPPHIGAHQAVRPYPHDRPHGRRPHRRRSRPCLASATHAAVHASVTTSPPPSPPPLRHHCPRQRRPLRHHPCRPDRRHDETVQLCPGGAHMVSGAQQGRLLHMLVRLSRASRVFEVRWQHQRHP